jgi:hypothetical protein
MTRASAPSLERRRGLRVFLQCLGAAREHGFDVRHRNEKRFQSLKHEPRVRQVMALK